MYSLTQSYLALNRSPEPCSTQALDVTKTIKPVFIHPAGNVLDFTRATLELYSVNRADNRALHRLKGLVSVMKKGQSE